MQLKAIVAVFATSFLIISACNSEADVGGDCDKEGGTTGQCTSAGVCGKDPGGKLVCLRRCIDQVECPQGELCGGVASTDLKGCRAAK
jgi:hypothetical protein